jgi:S-adenosylmethionine:tRNA ribosyltransferase-isomerase
MFKPIEDIHNLNSYSYNYPEELVAHRPKDKREQANLLVRDTNDHYTQHKFYELNSLLPKGSLLIFNNSKVFNSRIYGRKTSGAKLEIFLLTTPIGSSLATCTALVSPMKKIKLNTTIVFANDIKAEITTIYDNKNIKTVALKFNVPKESLNIWLEQNASTPLPPYIKTTLATNEIKTKYQTIYAKNIGSVAAPTAGLHFSESVFTQIEKAQISTAYINLHIGLGTFLPVREIDIKKHNMHKEKFSIPQDTLKLIEKTRANNKPIICVGTTTLRALETLFLKSRALNVSAASLCNQELQSELFIYPQDKNTRYKPQAANALITNFHQPKSTLFMLICALIGKEETHRLYTHAITNRFKLFSFGDSSLLWLR